MYLEIALAGVQLMLFWLKMTGQFDGSWWIVIAPTIAWCFGGVLFSVGRKKE